MIRADEVVPLLLEVAPGFQPHWEEHLATWGAEPRGAFNDAATFAQYLVERYAAGLTTEFPAVFAALERVLQEGDETAQAIAGVGVIEDLQTISSHREFDAGVFLDWLGPEGRRVYHRIQDQWAGKNRLADVIRSEKAADD